MVRGLWSQINVVRALLLRETRTRFGEHQLGYLWAFAEPMMFVGTFYLLFKVTERAPPDGMGLVSFLITGIIPYVLFQWTASRAVPAVPANKSLLFYPQVKPLDILIARSLLELATLMAVFAILMGVMAIWSGHFAVNSLLLTWCGLTLSWAFGASLGLVLSSVRLLTNTITQFVGVLLRPFFWLSGLFFTGNQVPSHIRELLAYNPLFNTIEMVREGWFPTYHAVDIRVGYTLGWILGLGLLGLVLERMTRHKVELT